MAVIKIPSKHIYEMQNEKVIDNDIDKIEVQAKTVVPDNHYDETVYNENIIAEISFIANALDNTAVQYEIVAGGINPSISGRYMAAAYCRMIPYYFSGNFSVSKRKDTKTLIKNYGIDENGKPQINYSTECEILESGANASVIYQEGNNRLANDLVISTPSKTTTDIVTLPKELTETATVIVPTNAGADETKTATAKVELLNDETYFQCVSEDNEKYYFEFKVFCGGEFLTLKNSGKNIDTWIDSIVHIPVSGINTKYVPKSVTITVYGDTIGIDLQDNTITIGDGKNVISFQGNELVQTTNSPSIESQYQTVLNEWKEGKETATLRCGIADYYDTNGAKAVSISKENGLPMSFQIGDIVCPYVFGANGKDRPMSVNKDGAPKNFEVISKRMIYDGAVWQEIGLQEKK